MLNFSYMYFSGGVSEEFTKKIQEWEDKKKKSLFKGKKYLSKSVFSFTAVNVNRLPGAVFRRIGVCGCVHYKSYHTYAHINPCHQAIYQLSLLQIKHMEGPYMTDL